MASSRSGVPQTGPCEADYATVTSSPALSEVSFSATLHVYLRQRRALAHGTLCPGTNRHLWAKSGPLPVLLQFCGTQPPLLIYSPSLSVFRPY